MKPRNLFLEADKSESRHTPRPVAKVESQLAGLHIPLWRIMLSGHEVQAEEPPPRHEAQEGSQGVQLPVDESRKADLGQWSKHRLDCRTGRLGGHERHEVEDGEEQVEQSGEQGVHVPFRAMVFDGQVGMQFPSWA